MDVDKVTKEVEWAHEEVDKMVEEMTKVKKIAKKIVFYALNWREEWAEGLVWTCILSREVKDFSDVTQACEDGHQEKGHKVILASSSPFLKDLLVKNKHPHPLIYMRGV